MAKKIYDIVPPKLARKAVNTAKTAAKDGKRIKHHKEVTHHNKKSNFPLKEILVGGGVIVVLLSFYAYIKLPKADIQISPKMDTLTLQEKITADKSINSVSLASKVIPAQYVEIQKDGVQEFPATGSASNDGKATGTIVIYNKITPLTSFTLIKGTHFLSDSGKYFITLAKITIPAAKNVNGKIVAGSVSVQVQAEESGKDYNIGSSKFSIPKLYGTSYYYSVYAGSDSPMSGGYTGQVKKVTSNDIQTAKDVLTKKLLADAQISLKNNLSPGDILIDGATISSVINSSSDTEQDAIADKFNESASVKVSALVFKKQDLEKLVQDDILSQLQKDNDFIGETLNISYDPGVLDIKAGKLTLNLQSSVKTYYKIDTNNLIDLFSMKSSDQIKQIIDQMYSDKVSELRVNFWPFWVNKAPENKDRIKIDLLFQ